MAHRVLRIAVAQVILDQPQVVARCFLNLAPTQAPIGLGKPLGEAILISHFKTP
jgi:hypothetical protein